MNGFVYVLGSVWVYVDIYKGFWGSLEVYSGVSSNGLGLML